MASDDVLKEFIVALGFRVDEEKHKLFQRSLKLSTEEVNKLGLAIGSVSVALAAGFQRITDQFASLYYTSQLTGQTIQSLKDLQYAAGQVGLSAGDMNSSLRTLSLLLAQPGGEALIRQYTGFKGHIADAHQALELLGRTWQKMFASGQGFMARAQIGNLGLNVPAMEQYSKNIDRAEAAAKDYDDRLQKMGIHTKYLADQSIIFKNELALIGSQFGFVGDLAVQDFISPINTGLKAITDETVALSTAFADLGQNERRALEIIGGIAGAGGGLAVTIATLRTLRRMIGLGGGAAATGGAAAPGGGVGLFGLIGRGLLAGGALAGGIAAGGAIEPWVETLPGGKKTMDWIGNFVDSIYGEAKSGIGVPNAIQRRIPSGDQSGQTIPLPGLLHHESYQPDAGEGAGGLFHRIAYHYGMDTGGTGNALTDWLHGTSGFTPAVRVVGFGRDDGTGTSPTGIIPASYEPGGGSGSGGSQAPLGPGGTPGKMSEGGAALANKLYLHARAPVDEGGLGMDRAHALAMIGAGAFAESYLNPAAVGDNGTSFGMFQEHGARGTAMLGALGPNWRNDPLGQLDFAFKEQQQRDPGWFQRGGSAGDLGNDWERGFERPAHPTDRSAFVDGISRALGSIGDTRLGTGDVHHHHGDKSVTIHAPQTVTINGQADASAVGAMHTAHDRKLATAVRNISTVFS